MIQSPPIQNTLEFSIDEKCPPFTKLSGQLLKWIGNKQRFAPEIISFFPKNFNNYFEPFLGSGAILGTLAPKKGIGSDVTKPLIGIFQAVKENPGQVIEWYTERHKGVQLFGKKENYEMVKESFDRNPNPADFLFLSRSCYGGVIRFRKADGYMSTPCGAHNPMPPSTFATRVKEWSYRIQNTDFLVSNYLEMMQEAKSGDLIYCDPPYTHSQAIVYGAQDFRLEELLNAIEKCKSRGVKVALSIDGTKKSGNYLCDLPIPKGLFQEEVYIRVGRSMLRRFQMDGQTLESEKVKDRLLLTY